MITRNAKNDEDQALPESAANSTDEQFDTVAMVLGQALLRFLERSNSRIAKKVLENLAPMASQMTKVETQQRQLDSQLASIEKILSNLSSHTKLLENASQTNLLLGKQHYEDCIIQPMARSLFTIMDLIEDSSKSRKDNDGQAGQDQAELIESIKVQLEQFFDNYGIRVIRHDSGSPVDPQLMKPVSKVSTTEETLQGCIAESLQIGFMWGQQRLLRPESVSIYQFAQTSTNPIEARKGGI